MITIKTYGLDPYLLRDISKDLTKNLADLYEINKDEIDFIGLEGLVVHDGVEQNTWNVLIEVTAPLKVDVLEDDAFDLIEHYFKQVSINIKCIFRYFSSDNYHLSLNDEFPRFMEERGDEDDFDITITHEGSVDEETDIDDIYLGNSFEDFEEKMKN